MPAPHAGLGSTPAGGDTPAQLLDGRVDVDGLPGGLAHELGHGGPTPRGGEVELAALVGDGGGAPQLRRKPRHQLLHQHRQVPVVGVGLVELEHRELRVVARRQALVAEHPGDLEHLLEPPHHEPLQVELGRDAQEQIGVERVVMGDEGLGQRPAGDGVEHGRLHLDEPEPPRADGAAS